MGAAMFFRSSAAAAAPLPRYRASGDNVICDFGGGAFLVCTITQKIAGEAPLAELLADALNRNPMLGCA